MNEITAEKRKRGRPRSTSPNNNSSIVLALDRGLIILEAIAQLQSATLSELALHVDMPPSSVHRVLITLQSHGFASFDSGVQEWAIGIGAFRIGSTYLERSNLIEVSLKVMRELTAQTGETSNLGIQEAGNIVFVLQVETKNPIRAMFSQGTGSPMHASGIGKALLAEMTEPEVHKILTKHGQTAFTPHTLVSPKTLSADLDVVLANGWAIDNEERYVGMRCIAAAVHNEQGQAIAGLSISAPTARFTDSVLAETGPIVRAAAQKLTAMIGGKARLS